MQENNNEKVSSCLEVRSISYQCAIDFLLPKHYSGRKPQIKWAFGWYDGDELLAVCTFGKPASDYLCRGICGEKYKGSVYELNRLCRVEKDIPQLSQFVSKCLKILKKENLIIVSYSDTAMNHHGYIYQAYNFLYTGETRKRTDRFKFGKHARHWDEGDQSEYRVVRSVKHRYVYFCTSNRKLKKEWRDALKWEVKEYPKGDNNPDYTLGEYLEETIIKAKQDNA